jgi:hypothetical protein
VIVPRLRLASLVALLVVGGAAWGVAAVGEWAQLQLGGAAANEPLAPPAAWPKDSALPRNAKGATLLVFAHPHCPRSKSTLVELAVLMARAPQRCSATVAILAPAEREESWWRSEMWERATSIPGVRVRADRDGREARRFGVHHSGHALLYDSAGLLVFSGGIDASHGRAGASEGRELVTAWLNGEISICRTTPVLGSAFDDLEWAGSMPR